MGVGTKGLGLAIFQGETMIVVIEGNNGYTIAHNGQLLKETNKHGHHVPARFTTAEVDELRTALAETLSPVDTAAVTPAKARLMRYPVKSSR